MDVCTAAKQSINRWMHQGDASVHNAGIIPSIEIMTNTKQETLASKASVRGFSESTLPRVQ